MPAAEAAPEQTETALSPQPVGGGGADADLPEPDMFPTHALIAKVDAVNESRPQLASQLAELAAETLNVVDTAVAGELRLRCETLLEQLPPQLFHGELDFIDLFSGCGGRVLGCGSSLPRMHDLAKTNR